MRQATFPAIPEIEDIDMTDPTSATSEGSPVEIPGKLEMYEGRLQKVVDSARTGWWRFHQHYDRDGYCDNPARGY